MHKNDLTHIFQNQLHNDDIFFKIIDGDFKDVVSHKTSDIETLIPMLSCFQYNGTEECINGNIFPVFIK